MDVRNLQAFVAVADCASFSQAAERLHLSQPAVSKRITALEDEVGLPLFDRIGRRVSLTAAGQALRPRAQQILEAVEDSRRALTNLTGRVEGRLSLGTSHHIGLHHLPPILRSFTAQYPKVQLDLRFLDSEAACRAVEQGELELAVVTLPTAPPPALALESVWHDPLALVAAKDHPLARQGKLTPLDLAAHPAILPASGTYTRQVVEAAFRPYQLLPEVSLSTNYLETIKMLVSVGLGWSVLPRTMLDHDIVALPVRDMRLSRELGIVSHVARTPSNAATAFAALLRKSVLTTTGAPELLASTND